MKQQLTIVGLGVADVAAARAFYERLGWRASSMSNEHIAFFQAGGALVSLFGRAALLAEAGVPDPAGAGSTGMTLACNLESTEAVDAALATAVEAGGRITAPAEQRVWGGYSGYFADPDGHVWEVAWNPHLEMDAGGIPRLPE